MRRANYNVYAYSLLVKCIVTLVPFILTNVSGFSTTPNNPRMRRGHQPLNAISSSQIAVLDGSNLSSLESFLSSEGISLERPPSSTPLKPSKKLEKIEEVGFCQIVVGTLQNQKIVGIAIPTDTESTQEEGTSRTTVSISKGDGSDILLYKDSIAQVPDDVNDSFAISTCIAALVGVHCAVHAPSSLLEGVGGSADNFKPSIEGIEKKVIVVGGGEYASFLTDALGAIGAEVTQISTNKLLRPRKQGPTVKIMPPDVGKMSVGFASVVGKFDTLVDTLSDESRLGESRCIGDSDDWTNDSSKADECKSAVILELEKQHNCQRYLSTMNRSQRIVRDEGILFGRKEADQYVKLISSEITFKSAQQSCKSIQPPRHFGIATLEPLLKSKVLYKNYKARSDVLMQGWSLKDYWELTSWPRDSTAGANIRFGFPVVDDLNSIFESEKESTTPQSAAKPKPKAPLDEYAGKKNPYVTSINTIKDLDSKIIDPKIDCVLFLSTSFCRTCKYLTPKYTRIARIGNENEDETVFAKANVGSKEGKMISRLLGVDAVPAFVLFQNGKRYGDTLSISKLPSQKLDFALDFMKSGKKWDRSAFLKQIDS